MITARPQCTCHSTAVAAKGSRVPIPNAKTTAPAEAAVAQITTAETLGWQLRGALPPMRLQSVTLCNHEGDVLWLSEGALGPDEHGFVVEAMSVLTANNSLPHTEGDLQDGRYGVFLPARSPQGEVVALVMILADTKGIGTNVAARVLTQQVRLLLQKIAILLRPQTVGGVMPPAAVAPSAAGVPPATGLPSTAAAAPPVVPAPIAAPRGAMPAVSPPPGGVAAPGKSAAPTMHTAVQTTSQSRAPAAIQPIVAPPDFGSTPSVLSPLAVDDILSFELVEDELESAFSPAKADPPSNAALESLAIDARFDIADLELEETRLLPSLSAAKGSLAAAAGQIPPPNIPILGAALSASAPAKTQMPASAAANALLSAAQSAPALAKAQAPASAAVNALLSAAPSAPTPAKTQAPASAAVNTLLSAAPSAPTPAKPQTPASAAVNALLSAAPSAPTPAKPQAPASAAVNALPSAAPSAPALAQAQAPAGTAANALLSAPAPTASRTNSVLQFVSTFVPGPDAFMARSEISVEKISESAVLPQPPPTIATPPVTDPSSLDTTAAATLAPSAAAVRRAAKVVAAAGSASALGATHGPATRVSVPATQPVSVAAPVARSAAMPDRRTDASPKLNSHVDPAFKDLSLSVQLLSKLRPGGRTKRYEVLLRNKQNPTALLAADEIIRGLDERSDLDGFVVSQLLTWISEHPRESERDSLTFSINLSARALQDERFPELIGSWLRKTGVAAETIGFELPESMCVQHPAQAERFVAACEKLGCFIVLDDFTLDSRAVNFLRSKALKLVKLEPRLTNDAMKDKLSQALVIAISQAAKVLGVHCAAKKIESQMVRRWITAIGFDFGQGALFEGPHDLNELLTNRVE